VVRVYVLSREVVDVHAEGQRAHDLCELCVAREHSSRA
jgi:hypothetical protein